MEFIVTVMASDRPGIAERIAREIEAYQGNWLESRLATMAGKFAGIIRVDVPESNFEKIQKALQKLRDEGLSISIELGETQAGEQTEHRIEVTGNDRPGIVREVTNALMRCNANIVDLHTEIEPASMSGGVIFRARVEFILGEAHDLDDAIAELESLSPDLMVDRK